MSRYRLFFLFWDFPSGIATFNQVIAHGTKAFLTLKIDFDYCLFLQFKFPNMKRILIGITTAIILMLSLSSCFYDEGLPETPPDNISFSFDIQPIFTTNCTSCHPTLVSSPNLTVGNSYGSITNGIYIIANEIDASLLYQRLLGNPSVMPPSGSLSTSDINLVKTWIERGALNN